MCIRNHLLVALSLVYTPSFAQADASLCQSVYAPVECGDMNGYTCASKRLELGRCEFQVKKRRDEGLPPLTSLPHGLLPTPVQGGWATYSTAPSVGGTPVAPSAAPALQSGTGSAAAGNREPVFFVQVGVARSEDQALALVSVASDQLQSVAQITRRNNVFRVRLGPFASREEAERVKDWVEQKGVFQAKPVLVRLATAGIPSTPAPASVAAASSQPAASAVNPRVSGRSSGGEARARSSKPAAVSPDNPPGLILDSYIRGIWEDAYKGRVFRMVDPVGCVVPVWVAGVGKKMSSQCGFPVDVAACAVGGRNLRCGDDANNLAAGAYAMAASNNRRGTAVLTVHGDFGPERPMVTSFVACRSEQPGDGTPQRGFPTRIFDLQVESGGMLTGKCIEPVPGATPAQIAGAKLVVLPFWEKRRGGEIRIPIYVLD